MFNSKLAKIFSLYKRTIKCICVLWNSKEKRIDRKILSDRRNCSYAAKTFLSFESENILEQMPKHFFFSFFVIKSQQTRNVLILHAFFYFLCLIHSHFVMCWSTRCVLCPHWLYRKKKRRRSRIKNRIVCNSSK